MLLIERLWDWAATTDGRAVAALANEAADAIMDLTRTIDVLRGRLWEGPLPAHSEVSTPVDPRSDCSLTHWVVRT